MPFFSARFLRLFSYKRKLLYTQCTETTTEIPARLSSETVGGFVSVTDVFFSLSPFHTFAQSVLSISVHRTKKPFSNHVDPLGVANLHFYSQ